MTTDLRTGIFQDMLRDSASDDCDFHCRQHPLGEKSRIALKGLQLVINRYICAMEAPLNGSNHHGFAANRSLSCHGHMPPPLHWICIGVVLPPPT